MKVIAAYLLAKLGKENPTPNDLKKIFESVGAEIDESRIDLLFSLLEDHDVTELIAAGREKLAALSSGGPAVVTGGGGGVAASSDEPVDESKKKVEEEKDESSDGGGMMSLFD